MQYALQLREIFNLLPEGEPRETFCQRAESPLTGNSILSPGQVKQGLASLGFGYKPQKISFINLKGGVGKTTTAVTLASRAAQLGYQVCLLDLDSQAAASLALGVEADEETPVFYDVWQKPQEMVLGSLHRLQEHLYLLPSSLQNGLLASSLNNPVALKKAASQVCQVLSEAGFDLLIMDCPPSLGAAVISSICAADTIVIPLGYDKFSVRGMELTLKETEAIGEAFGLDMPRIRLLLTGVDRRIKLWQSVQEQLRETYGQMLLPLTIRTSSEYARALQEQRTVFARNAKTVARQDHDRLARILLGLDDFGARLGRVRK